MITFLSFFTHIIVGDNLGKAVLLRTAAEATVNVRFKQLIVDSSFSF